MQRLPGASGPLLAATVLAAVSAFVVGMFLKPDNWRELEPLFFLTTLACAAVLLPARLWSGPADESWPRRLVFLGLGLLIGMAALCCDDAQAPRPATGTDLTQRIFGLLYADNHSLPLAACYLSYFGLMFITLRWWKIAEESRPRRLNVQPIVATAFWAYLLLFLLPAAPQRLEGFFSLVLTSFIVQIVSPWAPRSQPRGKRLRLLNA